MKESSHDYAAGIAAGVATVLTGHPFDTVKVRLQTQHTASHLIRYNNALHCASDIIRTEGIKGLYKGAASSFLGVSMESSLLFGAYSQIKSSLQGEEKEKLNFFAISLSAAVAGAGISFILCPTELVKCRLQVQSSTIKQIHSSNELSKFNPQKRLNYSGPLDAVKNILECEGVKGMYRGLSSTLLRESIGNTIFFGIYEITRHHAYEYFGLGSRPKNQVKRANSFVIPDETSALPTLYIDSSRTSAPPHGCNFNSKSNPSITVAEKSNPFLLTGNDVVECRSTLLNRRIQRNEAPSDTFSSYGRYSYFHMEDTTQLKKNMLESLISLFSGGFAGIGFWLAVFPLDVAKTRIQTSLDSNTRVFHNIFMVYKASGLKSLYSGLTPTLVRAFPANAAAIFTWEFVSRMLNNNSK